MGEIIPKRCHFVSYISRTSIYILIPLHTVYIEVCTVTYIVHADMYCYILSQTSDLTIHTLFEVVYDGMTRYEPVQNKMKTGHNLRNRTHDLMPACPSRCASLGGGLGK